MCDNRSSEQQLSVDAYRAYFANANLGLAITSPTKGWLHANQRLCAMLGYTEHELRHTTWAELTHPDDLAADEERFDKLLAGRFDSYALNKRFIRKNGSILSTHLTVACERDAEGQVQRVLATLTDRSDEAAVLEALRVSDERFQLLAASTLDGLWDWDIGAGTLWLSPSWKAQLGWRDDELTNSFETWTGLLHSDDQGLVMEHLQAFLAEPVGVWQETFRLAHRDGGWRQIMARAIGVIDAKQRLTRLFGVHIDITKERQAVGELRAMGRDLERILKERTRDLEQEKGFIETIFNTARAIIMVLSPEARVLRINPFFEQLTGWPADYILGRDWIDTMLPATDRSSIRGRFREALRSQRTNGNVNPILTRDGGFKYISWHDEVITDDAGEPAYLVAVGIDVTAQRATELALTETMERLEDKVCQRTAALEAAQAALIQSEKLSSLGTLVAGLSHELNNPLMGIINYVQYARDKSKPDIAALLTKADRELHRISDIVANLLRFARPPTAQFGPVSLQEPARQAADLLAADLRGRGIQLQDNLPDKLPLVQAEASTLQQIFLNLIINARDAVMIRTERRITLSGGAEDDQIWVDIADTGPGIAPDLLGRIFDPFFSTKPPGQGTGLGLSVSSSIAAGFGGSLSVQATGADGSRFRVSLPRPGHAIDPEQP